MEIIIVWFKIPWSPCSLAEMVWLLMKKNSRFWSPQRPLEMSQGVPTIIQRLPLWQPRSLVIMRCYTLKHPITEKIILVNRYQKNQATLTEFTIQCSVTSMTPDSSCNNARNHSYQRLMKLFGWMQHPMYWRGFSHSVKILLMSCFIKMCLTRGPCCNGSCFDKKKKKEWRWGHVLNC